MIQVSEAWDIICSQTPPRRTADVPLNEALGCILAEPVTADRDLPPFNRATMDGFCLNTRDMAQMAALGLRIQAEIAAGDVFLDPLKPGCAIRIMTGSAVPQGADIVVKIEDCTVTEKVVKTNGAEFYPWLNIARQGEDSPKNGILVAAGRRVTASVAAVAASVGKIHLNVYRKPVVALLTTGNEVVYPDQTPGDFQIRDGNTAACRMMLQKYGVEVRELGIIPDDPALLEQAVHKGLECDLLIMTGGVSAGKYDYSPKVLDAAGIRKHYHQVKLRPGKPNFFGTHSDGTAVFGLPGNPVSVQVGFTLFAATYIRSFLGFPDPLPVRSQFTSKRPVSKHFPLAFYFPVTVTDFPNRVCEPFMIKSSGDFSNFSQADGLGILEADESRIEAGNPLPVIIHE